MADDPVEKKSDKRADDVDGLDDLDAEDRDDADATTSTGGTTAKPAPARRTKGVSGNPAKAGRTATATEKTRRGKQDKLRLDGDDPLGSRAWRSPRFLLGTILALGGIAWIAYYYLQVRPDGTGAEPGGPAFMGDIVRWNYVIGFGLILVGLFVLAHKSTPLGRGRGVVVGMLGCFLVGLLWICTFYVITDDLQAIPVFNDLGQTNLVVGIAFMAVGFTFATKWE